MSWDNFINCLTADDQWRSSSFARAFGVWCVTSFATVILTLSSSAQLPNSVLYATNSNGTIVGFDSAGNRTLVASSALLNGLSQDLEGLAFDNAGNLYVANTGANNIFKIDPSGAGSIFASPLTSLQGVAFDGSGNLLVATPTGVQQIDSAGNVSLFFDSAAIYGSQLLKGIAVDSAGNVFVADHSAPIVLQIDSTGKSSTEISTNSTTPLDVAFKGTDLFATFDNTEVVQLPDVSDLQINLRKPLGIVSDGNNLFVADHGGNAIFKFDTNGQSSIFADFDLFAPNFLAFGPALSTALVSIAPQFTSAVLQNAAIAAKAKRHKKKKKKQPPPPSLSVVVNRSGQLNQTATVLAGTVDSSAFSPQIFHRAFFDGQGTETPHYYSTNDPQFQAAFRAVPGRDYQPIATSLVFLPGEMSKAITIPLIGNNPVGGRAEFTVALEPQSAPLTVGPSVVESIINQGVVAEIVGLTNLQSAVNSDGTRDFSCTLKILNTSSTLAGPIRVSLVGHAGFTNGGSGPTPAPPPDVDLGTFAASSALPPNGSVPTAVNATIPGPQGDAYGYNTWYWVYAIVEEQQNGAWSAVAAPWLVIDGVRLVSGYINPDGTTTPRDLWSGGGVNTGTPGSSVPFNGNLGLLGGGPPGPIINIAVSPPAQVTEGGSATFIIYATPNTARPLVVGYAMSGTAMFGVDYTLSGNLGQTGQVTIPLGADFVPVTLTSNTDAAMEATETAVMTLVRQANGYTFPTAPKRKKGRKGHKASTPTVPAATVNIANGP